MLLQIFNNTGQIRNEHIAFIEESIYNGDYYTITVRGRISQGSKFDVCKEDIEKLRYLKVYL